GADALREPDADREVRAELFADPQAAAQTHADIERAVRDVAALAAAHRRAGAGGGRQHAGLRAQHHRDLPADPVLELRVDAAERPAFALVGAGRVEAVAGHVAIDDVLRAAGAR